MRWIAVVSVTGLLLTGASATAGTPSPRAPLMVTDTCSVCHGNDGVSPNSTFPDLAAQTKTYLDTQLKNFRDHQRADPNAKAYMWTMAGTLSDKEITKIAQYFSALKPPRGAASENPAQIAAGKAIFEKGIASENVPACASCHGDKAAGLETFPRLAGQHRQYLVSQLQAFRSKARDNATMYIVVQHVTNKQIRDVAAYLASL